MSIGGKMKVFNAIRSLHPTAEFSLRDGDYNTLSWHEELNGVAKPTKEEVDAEISRLDAEHAKNQYQRIRKEKYFDISEQLDMLYHDMVAGKLDTTGTWFNHVKSVKDSNPKL